MINQILTQYNAAQVVNMFFLYSFMGWIMECIVIRREKGFFENRGFAKSPFCIIYGFGAMIGYAVLAPFSKNYITLFFAGAIIATLFEFFTAKLMLKMFGNLWWDYTNKPLNYKGILCVESTLGWGLIAVLLFAGLHNGVEMVVNLIPQNIAQVSAFVLVCAYAIDFSLSLKRARSERAKQIELEESSIYGR